MKKFYSLVLAGAFMMAAPRAAFAADSYVCDVFLNPGNFLGGLYGNFGGITFSVYSGPNCSGTYQNFGTLCSQGETFEGCAANSAYHFETAYQTGSMLHSLQLASTNDTPVTLVTDVCQTNPGQQCIAMVNFK